MKNIAKPVRAYRVQLDGVAAPAGEAPEVQRGIDAGDSGLKPKLPTLIVLPFQNLSDDREQAYFSDGVSEDLITDLSKIDPDGKQIRGIRGNRIAMIFQDPMSSLNPVYTIGDQII